VPATAVAARTILVADDTAFVRDRFRAALEAAGHRAHAVGNAGAVLARLKADLDQIDLIVLDLRLPQANGVELVRAIRRIDPARPPIIVFSGTIASALEVRALAERQVAGYVNEYTAPQHIIPSLSPYLFPGSANRRSSPRVVLGVPVSCRFGNTIAAALTLNISSGGIAVRTTSPLDKGTEMKVRFRLPGGRRDVEAQARVAWVDRRVGMGLQFSAIGAEERRLVDEFVHSHFFSNRKA
jgi:uncharacterized protein (TIGR02266 family)